MKQKYTIRTAWILTAAFVLALTVPAVSLLINRGGNGYPEGGAAFGVKGTYGGTFTAFAAESEGESADYEAKTMAMYSMDRKYMILATNIDDVTAYQEVGYTVCVNGGEAIDYSGEYYYTGIKVNGADGESKTYTMKDIFPDDTLTGMIVDEIEYSTSNSYTITPYLVTKANERKECGTFLCDVARQYTLTVSDDYVTFADGGKTAEVWEYGTLPEIVYEREDYEIIGWYNMDNPAERWGMKGFSMPESDLTIKPVWSKQTYCTNVAVGGKVDLNDSSGNIDRIHTNGVNGFDRETLVDNMTTGVVMTGAGERLYAEEATVYSYPGGVGSGWTFISCVPCVTGKLTEIDFTMQNLGESTLSFEVWQTNSSTAPTSSSNPKQTVTLEPGESATFTLLAKLEENINILTYYRFLTAATDFELAVMEYVKVASAGAERTVTINNVAGSPYTVTKDGATEFTVAENTGMPALTVNAPKGYSLAGFFETDAPTVVYTLEDFTMPASDMVLTPYFTPDHDTETDFGVAIDYFHKMPLSDRISMNSLQGFDQKTLLNGMDATPVLLRAEGGQFYAGITTYSYTDGVQSGWSFVSMVDKTVESSAEYKFNYTFYNFGTEEISFDVYQTDSSSSPKKEGNPHTSVTIAKGESRTVTLTVTGFGNDNILLYYEFTASTSSDLSLGVNLYIDK